MAKASVDWDLCESNGICEAMAPDVFELDDEDLLQVEDPTVTDDNRERVQRAVAGCPKSALSIVEG
jgi:ferredoxin